MVQFTKNIEKRSLKTCKSPRDQNVPNCFFVLANCFVLRFSRKAKLAQKVVRFDPTMVSLPLDACRTKWPWTFDRFACLTCNFAPARRLSREMHVGVAKDKKNIFARWSNMLPLDAHRSKSVSDTLAYAFMRCLPIQRRFRCARMCSS